MLPCCREPLLFVIALCEGYRVNVGWSNPTSANFNTLNVRLWSVHCRCEQAASSIMQNDSAQQAPWSHRSLQRSVARLPPDCVKARSVNCCASVGGLCSGRAGLRPPGPVPARWQPGEVRHADQGAEQRTPGAHPCICLLSNNVIRLPAIAADDTLTRICFSCFHWLLVVQILQSS